jgi:hypothetical protein
MKFILNENETEQNSFEREISLGQQAGKKFFMWLRISVVRSAVAGL